MRPLAPEIFSESGVERFLDAISPNERHRMSHAESNCVKLVCDLFQVITHLEEKQGSVSVADRTVLDFVLCALGPPEVQNILAELLAKPNFASENAALIAYTARHTCV